METPKKYLILQEAETRKNSLFQETELFLYLMKGIIRNLALRNFSDISGKEYSEPWHKATFLIIHEMNIQLQS